MLHLLCKLFFPSLRKILANGSCCSNTGIRSQICYFGPLLKVKSYKTPQINAHLMKKNKPVRKTTMLKVLEMNHWAEQKGKLKLLIRLLHNVPLKDWKSFHLGTANFYTLQFINIEKITHIPILCLAETLASWSSIADFVIKINSLNLLLHFHFRVVTFRKY